MSHKKRQIWQLFLIFFKIGAFTFGGGYAMIALIHGEVVDSKKWITNEEMLDMVSIAESTPGVIAINMATFVGYKIGGLLGSLMATIAVIIVPFLIIVLITLFFIPYMSNQWVQYAFNGIRCGIVVLIINAAVKLNKVNKKNLFNSLLTIISFIVAVLVDINVIYILIAGMICGIIYNIYINKANLDKELNK